MQWSRYNKLFKSERFGLFIYNALSNVLMELDQAHYAMLESLSEGHRVSDLPEKAFQALLCEKHVLVEPGEEEGVLLAQQYQRLAACFDTSVLWLTICPTLRCNFRCPYCFESSQQDGKTMTVATAHRLVDWIAQNKEIRAFHVTWYGGEPLLAFDAICVLTEELQRLDAKCEDIHLITNGYLLDGDKIARLNDLRISRIQITLDGPREIHDARRVLAGGGPTFDRILKSVDDLMDSDYAGHCTIRVNVDKRNAASFLDLRMGLLERFRGKRLSVYPGHVDAGQSHPYDHGLCFDTTDWAGFNLGLYHSHGILPGCGLHPSGFMEGICIATRHNGFVVGPEGELYKCRRDVGKPGMVVGNIHGRDPITHPVLRAQYVVGMDAYNDPECRACERLPICGGACTNTRLRSKLFGEGCVHFCSPFKDHLVDYLEAYIDSLRTMEICAAVLAPGGRSRVVDGYRVVLPAEGMPGSGNHRARLSCSPGR